MKAKKFDLRVDQILIYKMSSQTYTDMPWLARPILLWPAKIIPPYQPHKPDPHWSDQTRKIKMTYSNLTNKTQADLTYTMTWPDQHFHLTRQ